MKPLSDKLAQLSAQAKEAEDRFRQAQSEAHDRVQQRRADIRRETEQALDKVKQNFAQVRDDAQTSAKTLKAKVDADFESLRQQAQQDHRDFKAWQADNYASDKEADAAAAIDYAIAATRMAELATLNAISARATAIDKGIQADVPPVTA